MSGEIRSIRDSEGVSRQIDYQGLANKPFSTPTASDAGKSLTVGSTGVPAWSRVIPVSDTNDAGKALVVDSGGEAAWGNVLPTRTVGDAGKSLVVDGNGAVMWDRVLPVGGTYGHVLTLDDNLTPTWAAPESPSGDSLPSYGHEDDGKALVVHGCGDLELAWEQVLPTHDTNDAGKSLVIGDDGSPVWAVPSSPSSGGGIPPYGEYEDGKVLTVVGLSGDNYEAAWADVPVPEWIGQLGPGGDGEALVADGSGEPQWGSILPYYDSSDAGKSLKVNANGDGLEWA